MDIYEVINDSDRRLKPVYKICVGMPFSIINKNYEIKKLMGGWCSARFDFTNSSDLIELLTTSSMNGLYIDSCSRKKGIVYIHLVQDYSMDNINAELIDRLVELVNINRKIEDRMKIDELIFNEFENNDIDLGMP